MCQYEKVPKSKLMDFMAGISELINEDGKAITCHFDRDASIKRKKERIQCRKILECGTGIKETKY